MHTVCFLGYFFWCCTVRAQRQHCLIVEACKMSHLASKSSNWGDQMDGNNVLNVFFFFFFGRGWMGMDDNGS